MNIESKLREEIESELKALKDIEVGTDCYKTTVDGVSKLIDKKIELAKTEADEEFKREQFKSECRDRKIKNGITIGGSLLTVGVTIWGTLKSLKFEETGSITSSAGRQFITKLFRK